MFELIFDECVQLLNFVATQLGMTYKEINVWIFVILWPTASIILIFMLILQQRKLRKLQNT